MLSSLNRFNLLNYIISYSTFQQAWEVIKEKDGFEISTRWFSSKEKAEDYVLNQPNRF